MGKERVCDERRRYRMCRQYWFAILQSLWGSKNAVEHKQRGGEMRMNHTEKTIPVWKKYSLNVSEAAEYYGIGEKRLRQIAGENEGADFILEVGSHIRFKRKLFEDYLDTASTV